jgi:hypothetical protein
VGKTYTTLLINDTSTAQARWMAREGSGDSYTIDIDFSGANEQGSDYPGVAYLAGRLAGLVQDGVTFRKCIVTTHGAPGVIKFGTDELTTYGLYTNFYSRGFHRLFPSADATVYFAGCQVAVGTSGWKFLAAAARCLMRGAGGSAVGWTSNGWKIPFRNAPVHLSGDVRMVLVSAGGDTLRFYEEGKLISDEDGFPVSPY